MLFLKGVGYKDYPRAAGAKGSGLPAVPCPVCWQRLEGHGGYRRYVGGQLAWIRRGFCVRCQVSHAIVAEDLVAYRDLTLGALEIIWEASGPSAASGALGQSGPAAGRRIRAASRRVQERIRGQVLSMLPALEGQGLGDLARVFGSTLGILVRLRAWLWSSLSLFFSGLTGLWRHGRPPHLVRAATYKPW